MPVHGDTLGEAQRGHLVVTGKYVSRPVTARVLTWRGDPGERLRPVSATPAAERRRTAPVEVLHRGPGRASTSTSAAGASGVVGYPGDGGARARCAPSLGARCPTVVRCPDARRCPAPRRRAAARSAGSSTCGSAAADAACRGRCRGRASTPADVAALLGRGDGLTPYGDDVLCGWLAVHRAAGVADARRSTPRSARSCAPDDAALGDAARLRDARRGDPRVRGVRRRARHRGRGRRGPPRLAAGRATPRAAASLDGARRCALAAMRGGRRVSPGTATSSSAAAPTPTR